MEVRTIIIPTKIIKEVREFEMQAEIKNEIDTSKNEKFSISEDGLDTVAESKEETEDFDTSSDEKFETTQSSISSNENIIQESEFQEIGHYSRYFDKLLPECLKIWRIKFYTLNAVEILKELLSNSSTNRSFLHKLKYLSEHSMKRLLLIILALPCVSLLTIPLIIYSLILFLAALPVISFIPCLFFSILPLLWPQIKMRFQPWQLSQGMIITLSFIFVPLLFFISIPICFLAPITILFIIPWVILFLPVAMLILFPILFFSSIFLGIATLLYLSPVQEFLKTRFIQFINCLSLQKLISSNAISNFKSKNLCN